MVEYTNTGENTAQWAAKQIPNDRRQLAADGKHRSCVFWVRAWGSDSSAWPLVTGNVLEPCVVCVAARQAPKVLLGG